MECTQRLECTQELYETISEKVCAEQVGFLGICGVKHPVKRGPNKIGRDPQTCSIVLNLNSVSRQHAVINVLNQKEYMLMDLDSANKTKLMDKTLSPYIPHPLKNGDLVQFGDIFGVFRLLEEDTDLPMTQAIDLPETQIPETPIASRHVSKMNRIPITTIPESPDVSDKDESFIAPSQPKKDKCFKNSNSHFVKPSAKLISIQPIGTNTIDNVYWNSSKKSVSLNSQFNDSNSSLNDSSLSTKTTARQSIDKSIYEMETQHPAPCGADDSTDSIYTANTQVPPAIHTANTQIASSIHTADTQEPSTVHIAKTQEMTSIHDENTQVPSSIYSANTQVPISVRVANTQAPISIHNENTQVPCASPSIHSLNTQLPPSTAQLPDVCKIDNQQDMQFNLFTSNNNQSKNHIFDAETQLCAAQDDQDDSNEKSETSKKVNASAEEIVFEEIDCQDFDNGFESQALVLPANLLDTKEDSNAEKQSDVKSCTANKKTAKKDVKKQVIIHSDSSTDCEDVDMLPTQKITKQADDDDTTDCEDLFDDVHSKKDKQVCKKTYKEKPNDNFEDMLTQVICEENPQNNVSNTSVNKTNHNIHFEDMLTQVIAPEDDLSISDKPSTSHINLEDLPTQVIVDDEEGVIIADKPTVPKDTSFEDLPTQVIVDKNTQKDHSFPEFISPFKIPLMSPLKAKRKDAKVITPKSKPDQKKVSPIVIPDDDNYYAATQDILEDLCTQPDVSPNVIKECLGPSNNNEDDFLPSSVEEYRVGSKFPHLENNLSPKRKLLNTSLDSSDGDEIDNNFVSKLSSQDIRDVIGVEPQVDKVKRIPSDNSDVEITPKKVRPIKFMDIDLPNSQEIKTSVSMHSKVAVTESSSESEVENDSEECTPILFHKKKKSKVNAKVDLTMVFAAEALPSRVITRVRKPTNKFQNDEVKKLSANILKPKFMSEQEDEIDKEIITENLSRLKSKSEKYKNKEAKKLQAKQSKMKDESKLDEKENSSKVKKADIKQETKVQKHSAQHEKDKQTDNEKVKPIDKSKENNSKQIEIVTKRESSRRSDEKHVTGVDVSKASKDAKDIQVTNVTIDTSVNAKSKRNTRNRRKLDKVKEKSTACIEDGSRSDEKIKTSRKPNLKKTIEIDLTEEVVEVRRSRRQKPKNEKSESSETKEKAENSSNKPTARRGRPPKHSKTAKAEQSTIYSLSSESGTDSPRMKRSAPETLDPPSPKRTRSAVNPNASSRATPARINKTHHVLFTAFPCEEVKAKLEKLGAVVVTDVTACSVVLTLAVKRTFKLLCAVGLGRPIVGPAWVQACVDTNTIVDPWLYILKDEVAEKRFQFSLEKTLIGNRNFLKGFNVSSTPKVMPNTPEMKLIVECSGGTWKEDGPQWICVSCSADKSLWPALKRRGAVVVSTEFILGGVLRQRADITSNKL